jgi:hypothetical protein
MSGDLCPTCGQPLPEPGRPRLDPAVRLLGRQLVQAVQDAMDDRAHGDDPHPQDPHRFRDGRYVPRRGGP